MPSDPTQPPTQPPAEDRAGPEGPAVPARTEDSATERTGVPAVDEVLERLDGLQDRPTDEHVEVFERAHEQLRRALDDPGASAGPGPSAEDG